MRAEDHAIGTPQGDLRRRGAATLDVLLIGPILLALAAFMYLGPDLLDIPDGKGSAVHASRIDPAPRRVALADPPMIKINGFERTCMDCHRVFPAKDIAPEELQQHRHIRLDHGINDLCRNCHDVEDRDRLTLRGGESISYSEVELLCAKCHGPTYRDWEVGAHGRVNGYWDETRGELNRLKCTQCHDPHIPRVPAMDPIRPLPGPNTLRMGEHPAESDLEHGGLHDPLREALQRDLKTGGHR